MPVIDGTNLSYTESEGIVLDYFLGGSGESKEDLALRLHTYCSEYEQTKGLGNDGKGMPQCYAIPAEALWDGQVGFFKNEFSKIFNIPRGDLTDAAILEAQSLESYKTRTERHIEKKAKQAENLAKLFSSQDDKLSFYESQGRSDDEILITHPELRGALERKHCKSIPLMSSTV